MLALGIAFDQILSKIGSELGVDTQKEECIKYGGSNQGSNIFHVGFSAKSVM